MCSINRIVVIIVIVDIIITVYIVVVVNCMHLQSTHTPHFQRLQSDPHFGSGRRSVVELFCRNSLPVKAVGCFLRGAPSLMFNWNSKCDSVWGEGFHHWGYTEESWTPLASWFSWFTQNTNTWRWILGLIPRPHFLEGELIHLVDKKLVPNSRGAAHKSWIVKYCIPTLIPCIPHIPSIPTLIPCIPHIPSIPTPIPRILTLIPRVPIIVLIPFPDSSVRLLQIVNYSILFRWTYGYPSMLDKGFFLFGLDQAPTLSEFIIDTQEGNFRVI